MRLRDALALTTAMLALGALAGCGLTGRTHDTSFRDDSKTPQAASSNDVALAQQYIEIGQYEVALDRLQHAVKLDPSSADAYTMLGLLYEKINRPDQAEANYAKAAKLAPNKGDIVNNYGAWLCRSGHPAESDVWFRKALNDPFYKTPQAAIANAATCAMKAGNVALAEGYDRKLLALNASDPAALEDLAQLMYQRGDYLHARGFIERLMTATTPTPDMLDLAARIEEKNGDTDAARSYRSRIGTESPQNTPGQR